MPDTNALAGTLPLDDAARAVTRVIVCGPPGVGGATLTGWLRAAGPLEPGPLEPGPRDAGYGVVTTARRRLLIADALGAVEPRAMVVAAAEASVAVLVADADAGFADLTRRQAALLVALGVRRMLVAVEMGRSGWGRFEVVDRDARGLIAGLPGGAEVTVLCVPVRVADGANIALRGGGMDWYGGPALLEWLEEAGADEAPGGAGVSGRARGWLTRVRERPWRSLAKAVSWRATGSVDTFMLTFLVSGNARLAASVGGLEVFTKIFLYFVHERVWARISLGVRAS